ncbi:hypothetical protein ABEB36_001382 [Hypothenemus hampei]|uniref:C2H2-type domain-containing protein n=1 Tax=Hypothenemus hampei TaxID=57062 RepID=A0ABD1FGW1_HYPHA
MHSIKHSKDKKFKCPLCNYVSRGSNPYNFKSHLTYMHLKKFPYYCQDCGKGFKQLKTIQDHCNLHKGQKPYKCIVCAKSFTCEKYLNSHQVRNHHVSSEGEKSNQKHHVSRKTFKKPNSFLCDTCGQGFIEKSKLLKHIRVHNGDLPFVCNWCNKRFPQKDYLKTHERVHTGEKPYKCQFCGKSFGFHAPFRVHLRTHTGERPYKCHFCSKGFTTNQGLKLHLKNCPENLLHKMFAEESKNTLNDV